jgi:hypothetical protein
MMSLIDELKEEDEFHESLKDEDELLKRSYLVSMKEIVEYLPKLSQMQVQERYDES